MKEYVLTDNDIKYLKIALKSPKTYSHTPKNSIMMFEEVCTCNSGYLCEHRLKWLIDFIESKELRTRKAKLDRL